MTSRTVFIGRRPTLEEETRPPRTVGALLYSWSCMVSGEQGGGR
jgi:hypothetical protein